MTETEPANIRLESDVNGNLKRHFSTSPRIRGVSIAATHPRFSGMYGHCRVCGIRRAGYGNLIRRDGSVAGELLLRLDEAVEPVKE